MRGGDGDDVYFRTSNDARILETENGGTDIVYLGGAGPHTLDPHVEHAFLGVVTAPAPISLTGNDLVNHIQITGASVVARGGAGDDTILAEQWSTNTLFGDAGHDKLRGANWSDKLAGGTGNDTLQGMRGNDVLNGGAGADRLEGNAGLDTADYRANSTDIHVSLYTGRAYGGEAQGDRLSDIERVWGSNQDDVIMGDNGANILDGRDGSDFLHGYGGNDSFFAGAGADGIVGGAGFDELSYRFNDTAVVSHMGHGQSWGGHAQGDSYHGIEALHGSRGHDTHIGNAADNRLDGWLGRDYLHGGDGNDTLIGGAGADGLVGGRGTDVLDYSGSRAAIQINLGAYTAAGGDAEGDWFWAVESVIGSAYADTLTGGAADGALSGGQGADHLVAGRGATDMTGGSGADTFAFGLGALEGGASHRITDFAAQDTILLTGGVTVSTIDTTQAGTTATLVGELDGIEILSLLSIDGVTLGREAFEDDIDPDDPLLGI